MFKKKPLFKAFAPLRSSDRRKLAEEIIQHFGLEDTIGEEVIQCAADEQSTSTKERSSLRNALCPENLQSARFTTTQGPDLRTVSGTVFVGSHSSAEDQRALWFRFEDRIYPTVYTLWRHGPLVPFLFTADAVISKLQGGSDLMTPGLGNRPPFPKAAVKDAAVAVCAASTPDQPAVVGTCLIDISSLTSVQGAKGHAIKTLHAEGDELWSFSPSNRPGVRFEDFASKLRTRPDELVSKTSELALDEGGKDRVLLSDRESHEPVSHSQADEKETFIQVEKLSVQQIDTAFRNAFLNAIHYQKTNWKDTPNHGLVFPLTQSTTMTLLQPYLTSLHAEQTNQLQIKNSSFKNIKKFIKTLDQQGLVKSKDRDKHETVIVEIKFEHESITGIVPWTQVPRSGTTLTAHDASTIESTDQIDPSVGQKLDIKQYYKLPTWLPEVFGYNSQTCQSLTGAQLRSLVTNYVTTANLIATEDKRLVNLTPEMQNKIFNDPREDLDSEIRDRGTVALNALMTRIQTLSQPQWSISRVDASSNDDTPAKLRSGPIPKITVRIEQRSSNKSMTRVSGLEAFCVSPRGLADELRKTCACATSVERLEGSSPRAPVMAVRVQGSQTKAVLEALSKRGVGSQWIDGTASGKST